MGGDEGGRGTVDERGLLATTGPNVMAWLTVFGLCAVDFISEKHAYDDYRAQSSRKDSRWNGKEVCRRSGARPMCRLISSSSASDCA